MHGIETINRINDEAQAKHDLRVRSAHALAQHERRVIERRLERVIPSPHAGCPWCAAHYGDAGIDTDDPSIAANGLPEARSWEGTDTHPRSDNERLVDIIFPVARAGHESD